MMRSYPAPAGAKNENDITQVIDYSMGSRYHLLTEFTNFINEFFQIINKTIP